MFSKELLTAPRPYRLDAAFSVPQDPVDLANTVLASHYNRSSKKKKSLLILSWTLHRQLYNLSSKAGPRLYLQAYQVLYSLQTHQALVILALYFSNIIAFHSNIRGFALSVPSAGNIYPSELHYRVILILWVSAQPPAL